jgi:hypothetical protein
MTIHGFGSAIARDLDELARDLVDLADDLDELPW